MRDLPSSLPPLPPSSSTASLPPTLASPSPSVGLPLEPAQNKTKENESKHKGDDDHVIMRYAPTITRGTRSEKPLGANFFLHTSMSSTPTRLHCLLPPPTTNKCRYRRPIPTTSALAFTPLPPPFAAFSPYRTCLTASAAAAAAASSAASRSAFP